MLSLESVRIFMRAAETGSFSAAGRSLRLSPSVISYRIQTLEEHLGCLLLTRTTRRMNLTEAGRVFYDRCSTSPPPWSGRRKASRPRAPRRAGR